VFLLTVFLVLLTCIFLIGWISKRFFFGKIEPPFVGALVGASGTIFAACVAYIAATDNLEVARMSARVAMEQADDAKQHLAAAETKAAAHELETMRLLLAYCDALIEKLETAKKHANYYVAMVSWDELLPFYGNPPDPFRTLSTQLYQRLNTLRTAARDNYYAFQVATAEPVPKWKADYFDAQMTWVEPSTQVAVIELQSFRQRVAQDIAQHENAPKRQD
jgi:hypothetical protein